ncbi:restriction endonuclease [Cohnella cholangitidis]|uniref:Restriction endonuclease n=1 Tax=Cohnella cholangitidis TaxID=2598458 RepID=A0A7G5C473_9BACL|nr:restriction endonuclease [Cohnella cholangitidis]QMV44007.1 restriction endonuclease [Cohnella cholangitidis]
MLDFKELSKDGNDFELLVRELLFSMGFKVYWSGKGTDGGKDLLCVETPVSSILSIEKRWLVQCKHNAHANKAVSTSDLDEIVDSCSQYEATGYLLVCSTYPSSKLVDRLDGITRNKRNNVSATYWDSVSLERMLSTPKTWTIAQRFFPKSANEIGWKIYATESPNRWVVNFKGYYFHLSNRIGSYAELHLSSIKSRICDLESIKVPKKHKLRPRAVYYDDKNGVYTWYIDYMYPRGSKPKLSAYSIKKELGDGYALEDGQIYSFDVHVYDYLEISDHFDEDHYNYYQPYVRDFSLGFERKSR